MTKKFEFSIDTPETRIRVYGKTVQELFGNALAGMASFIKTDIFETKKKEWGISQEIRVQAVDIASLLVEFVSSALAHTDAHQAVFCYASFSKFGENFLEGTIRGLAVSEFDHDIKAVSYQDVEVSKNPETGMYETVLVFEI